MTKQFVLDTSVILYNPNSIFSFEEHNVFVPTIVLSELDKFKSEQSERGANAREFFRIVEKLIEDSNLTAGIPLGEGLGKLSVIGRDVTLYEPVGFDKTNDIKILGYVNYLRDICKRDDGITTLVTKDAALRVIANSCGISAEDYKGKVKEASKTGKVVKIEASDGEVDALYSGVALREYGIPSGQSAIIGSGKKTALVRFHGGAPKIVTGKVVPSGVKPKNAEQKILVDMLLDESLDMVVCAGVAGSGKTLLSMACGVHLVEKGKYDKIFITKSIQAVGNDIGYTKGSKEEKMAEWVKPFYDNLDFILRGTGKKRGPLLDDWIEDTIEVDAITYMRGRSLMHRFVIVDEVQNLHPSIIKTIVSRCADSAKLILLGDLSQIDNPYLDSKNNGLAHVMNNMAGLDNVGILNLEKSERGRLANLAIKLL